MDSRSYSSNEVLPGSSINAVTILSETQSLAREMTHPT